MWLFSTRSSTIWTSQAVRNIASRMGAVLCLVENRWPSPPGWETGFPCLSERSGTCRALWICHLVIFFIPEDRKHQSKRNVITPTATVEFDIHLPAKGPSGCKPCQDHSPEQLWQKPSLWEISTWANSFLFMRDTHVVNHWFRVGWTMTHLTIQVFFPSVNRCFCSCTTCCAKDVISV